jgi:hypothetical protein
LVFAFFIKLKSPVLLLYKLRHIDHDIHIHYFFALRFNECVETRTNLYHKDYVRSMKSQIFVAIGVALFAAVLVAGLASTIYAQSNMTGGNMTGGNMTSATGATGEDSEDENGDGNGEDDDDEGGSN